jgi:hypothetical protein
MNDSQIEDRPDSGKEWSEMDLYDLALTVRMDNSVEFIASFLRRSPREVRAQFYTTHVTTLSL